MKRQDTPAVSLSDAQRVLMRARHQFAAYPGVSEIGVARGHDGRICFLITCSDVQTAIELGRIDEVQGMPVKVEVEDIDGRVAASRGSR